jgi:L-2-hydroxycarboxylate dehydrogenase (NAD+)
MAMSGPETTVLVLAADEHRLIVDVLKAFGASEAEAAAQATLLVEGDLRGRHSHGIARLPTLIERIRRGLLRPGADAVFEWRTSAFVAIDGCHGFGPHVALAAIDALTSAAGLAVAAIRRTSHLGMLAPYVERLTERGFIGVALTTSEALVHPSGGVAAMIGTNPIAVGVPSAEGGPFVLDMTTASISAGEILVRARDGRQLPPGCAIDANGWPTVSAHDAVGGAISPFGGEKGYGLGLAIELLVGVLTQTALGRNVLGTLDAEHPATKGDLLLAFDPRALTGSEAGEYAAAYLAELRSLPAAPGSAGVFIPGDRSRALRARRLQDGIPLPIALWEAVGRLRVEAHA